MLQFVVIGLIQGAIIGLIALGIVLVYKGSRVFNFAQAEFGTVAAFVLYILLDILNLPYLVAVIGALIGAGLMGYLVHQLIVRPLFDSPRVTLLVATAGVALLAVSLEVIIGGVETRQLAPAISGEGFKVLGKIVTPQQLLMVVVTAVLALASGYFFKKTDLGLAVLATSQEPVATELVGIGTRRMSTFVWVTAAVLGGIAGVLQGPDTTFEAAFMTRGYLLLGFTAAVVGGITSLSGALVGGLTIGVLRQIGIYLDSTYVHDIIEIPGLAELMVFIGLVTMLIVRPQGLLGKEA